MLALEEVGSSLTRVKKWGDGLVGGANMHTTALYIEKTSIFEDKFFSPPMAKDGVPGARVPACCIREI